MLPVAVFYVTHLDTIVELLFRLDSTVLGNGDSAKYDRVDAPNPIEGPSVAFRYQPLGLSLDGVRDV